MNLIDLTELILSKTHSTPQETIETFYITGIINSKERQILLDLLAKNSIIT